MVTFSSNYVSYENFWQIIRFVHILLMKCAFDSILVPCHWSKRPVPFLVSPSWTAAYVSKLSKAWLGPAKKKSKKSQGQRIPWKSNATGKIKGWIFTFIFQVLLKPLPWFIFSVLLISCNPRVRAYFPHRIAQSDEILLATLSIFCTIY